MSHKIQPVGAARARSEAKISPREHEVLSLISHGQTNNLIADDLGVGKETVKTHVQKILTKLEAQSRAHAVAIALRRGYLE